MLMTFSMARADGDLATQLAQYNALIGADPVSYNLVQADADSLDAKFQAFWTALKACNPKSRNQTSVLTKNQAREALKTEAMRLAMIVAFAPSVSDELKLGLGIMPRATPQSGPIPTGSPTLRVVALNGTSAILTANRDGDGHRIPFPEGVIGVNLFSHVGESAPTTAAGWKFETAVGPDPVTVQFDESLAPETTVFFTGFYFNRRRISGPAAPAISANLPGGGALPSGVTMKIAA